MLPWNSWYHVTGNTRGTWLPGDPRGWTTRHARSQPGEDGPRLPADIQRLHAHSRRLLDREPVRLSVAARRLALDGFVLALNHHHIELVACAIDDHHYHVLARFTDHKPRRWIGIAKKESARALSRAALAPPGGVWAVRCHCKPIHDRAHQLDTARYITDHATTGAALWILPRRTPAAPAAAPSPS